jgi:hypothetical protein
LVNQDNADLVGRPAAPLIVADARRRDISAADALLLSQAIIDQPIAGRVVFIWREAAMSVVRWYIWVVRDHWGS